MKTIGKTAIMIALAAEDERLKLLEKGREEGLRICTGRVGTMNAEKVIAAVMTAGKRDGLWDEANFAEEHALYGAVVESLSGVCRGQLVVSEALRTVGLSFAIVRGQMIEGKGDWVAVCLYGTIGAPIRGFEHETVGLGLNHI